MEKEILPVTLPMRKMSEVADEFRVGYLFKKGSYFYNKKEKNRGQKSDP